jgi:hypothetical protein
MFRGNGWPSVKSQGWEWCGITQLEEDNRAGPRRRSYPQGQWTNLPSFTPLPPILQVRCSGGLPWQPDRESTGQAPFTHIHQVQGKTISTMKMKGPESTMTVMTTRREPVKDFILWFARE